MPDDLAEALIENEEYFNRIKYLEDQLKKVSEDKKKLKAKAGAKQKKQLILKVMPKEFFRLSMRRYLPFVKLSNKIKRTKLKT